MHRNNLNLKKYLMGTFIPIIATMTVSLYPSQNDQKSSHELPHLTKPIPCINPSFGEFSGICGYISRFQLLCAALNIIKQVPISESDCNNSCGHFMTKKLISTYFHHKNNNQALEMAKYVKSATPYNACEEDKRWKTLPRLWFSQSHNFYCDTFYSNTELLGNNLWNHTILKAKTKKPSILWLALPQEILLDVHPRENRYIESYSTPYPQTRLSIGNSVYRLCGASQSHVYSSPRYSINHRIHPMLPSSYLITPSINQQWTEHVDTYVRYGDHWYIMDDETRWQAHVIDNQGKQYTDPDRIAQALVHNYPGVPRTLVYELISDTDSSTLHNPQRNALDSDKLLLFRDTPRPTKRVFTTLAKAAALDAILPAALAFAARKSWKCALTVGTVTACISCYHHLQHLLPMLKKKLIYGKKHDSLSGPRAPLFDVGL
jgi:hypothetical protein